jgi:hypothetical protein
MRKPKTFTPSLLNSAKELTPRGLEIRKLLKQFFKTELFDQTFFEKRNINQENLEFIIEEKLYEFLSDEREIFLTNLMGKFEEAKNDLISERSHDNNYKSGENFANHRKSYDSKFF